MRTKRGQVRILENLLLRIDQQKMRGLIERHGRSPSLYFLFGMTVEEAKALHAAVQVGIGKYFKAYP